MNEITVGIAALVVLLGIFLTGMELAFAMAVIGVAGIAVLVSPVAALSLLANDFYDSLESYGMTVVPLFVLMGQITFNAGIASRLYSSAHKFLGHLPGGLAIATVAGAVLFKSICGSAGATVATFASFAVPEMDSYGYDRKLSTGIVATTGVLGGLIPPAVILIILAIITGESTGKLFLAGVFPALILSFLYVVVIIGWARINPRIAPKSQKYTWGERAQSLSAVVLPLVIFMIMISGMTYGFFTPTEAGSVGTFAVLLLCLLKKDINFDGIKKSVREALRTSCMVFLMVAGANMLGHFVTAANLSFAAADWVSSLPLHRHAIMVVLCLVYIVGGTFIDDLAFLILATPIFLPIMTKMGYDPIWICILLSIVMGIGSSIPPLAMNVFIVKNITKENINTIYRGVYPFLAALGLVIVLLFIFPDIALYLPSVLMK
jgi:C4-dicarboxylate transporter, DctM subunit